MAEAPAGILCMVVLHHFFVLCNFDGPESSVRGEPIDCDHSKSLPDSTRRLQNHDALVVVWYRC